MLTCSALTFAERVPGCPICDAIGKVVPTVPATVHPSVSVRVGLGQLKRASIGHRSSTVWLGTLPNSGQNIPHPARALLGSVGGKSDRRQPLHFTAMKYNTKCQDLYEMLASEGGGGRAEIWQAGGLLMAQAVSALLPLRRGGVEGSGPMQGHPAPSLLAHTSQMALTGGSKYARKTNQCQC